jgi:hypothetical protein
MKRTAVSEILSGSWRLDVNGWIFIRARGRPYEIGFQNGNWLANEIEDSIVALKLIAEWSYKRDWKFFRDAAMNLLWPKLPEEYKEEIRGIVAGFRLKRPGAHIELQDIVALNGYFDIASYHSWIKSKEPKPTPQLIRADHCSAFIATGDRTVDGRIVLAHNTWFQYLAGRRFNAILDITPARGGRFVMQAMPGTIASGTDWYMNENGLMVAETTITGMTTFNPDGLPVFLRSRKAVQYATSIDEWTNTMIDQNNGGYANDWLVGDRKTGEIVCLELGTFNHKLERTRNGSFIGSNMAMNDAVRSETTFDYNNKSGSCSARHERLEELMKLHEGALTVEIAKQLLADHQDGYGHTETPNRNTVCGHVESDTRGNPEWEYGPNYPGGTFDGKVTDSNLAVDGSFWAHWGKPCGTPFNAATFLTQHPEYAWQKPELLDIDPYPWTLFSPSPNPKPYPSR